MGLITNLTNWFRKSDRVVPHPEPTKQPESVAKSRPAQLRAALGGAFSGNMISNHREEALHYESYSYVAIHAVCMQLHSALIEAFADGNMQDRNVSRRKSMRAKFGTEWQSAYKASYGAEEAELTQLTNEHDLMRILKRPNPHEPGGMFRYRQGLQIRLTGGCYIWNVPNVYGITCQRYVIPTTAITPVYPTQDLPYGGYRVQPNCSRWVPMTDDFDEAFNGQGYISGSVALMQVIGMIIDARQIQKCGFPNPIWLDDWQSPMGAGAQWVDAERAINIARTSGVSRGLDPSILVTLPSEVADIDQDTLDRTQRAYDSKYGGPGNVGKAMVTAPGTDVKVIGNSPKDMAYAEGYKDTKEAVLALHNTPPVAVGIQEPGAYAAYVASMRAWNNVAIAPMCDILAESDTFWLAPQFGKGLSIEITPKPVNDESEINARVSTVGSLGNVAKVNEVRALYGWEPLPGKEGEEFAGKKESPLAGMGFGGQMGSGPKQDPDEQPEPPKVDGEGESGVTRPESPFARTEDSQSKALIAALEGMNEADAEFVAETLGSIVERAVESRMKSFDPSEARASDGKWTNSGSHPERMPSGEYGSLRHAENDYSPLGEVATAARHFAGMSFGYDKTHKQSVTEILGKVTPEKRVQFLEDPSRNRDAKAAGELNLIRFDIQNACEKDPQLTKIVSQIRGPLALQFIQEMERGGRLNKHPHLIKETAQQYAEESKPYRKKSIDAYQPRLRSQLKARWITVGSKDGEGGGTHIQIDEDGTILAGPKDLAKQGIRHISDFGQHKRGEHEKHVEEMIPHAHQYLVEHHNNWETAKQNARRITGLTAGDIARHENSYSDHSSIHNFDSASRTVAMEHPELGLDPDHHETPAKVWELIREGAKRKPSKNSPEVRKLAESWATQPKQKQTQQEYEHSDDWDNWKSLKARDPNKPRKFSSTQINLPGNLAERVVELGKMIPDDDLADDGREDEPHLTIKYGIHSNDPRETIDAVRNFGPVKVTIGDVSFFECAEYDVVKFDVISPQAIVLNGVISDACENTTTHPTYVPHVTIAYVRKGMGSFYAKLFNHQPVLSKLKGEWFAANQFWFPGADKRRKQVWLTDSELFPESESKSLGMSSSVGSDGGLAIPETKSFDESKHPRGHEGNPGQFASGSSAGSETSDSESKPEPASTPEAKVKQFISEAIDGGVKVKPRKYADVDDIEFESDSPRGHVKTKVKLSDGTSMSANVWFEIRDGKPEFTEADPDEVGLSKGMLEHLSGIGYDDDSPNDSRDSDSIRDALNAKPDGLITPEVLTSIRAGIEREIKTRQKTNDMGELSESMKKYLADQSE